MSYQLAFSIADAAHTGQLDKLGEPYIAHPVAVANLVTEIPTYLACTAHQQDVIRQAALLHDVIEDTEVDDNDLLCAGVSEDVVSLVRVLSHYEEEPRADYIARVAANPLARIVKLADLRHNTSPHRMSRLPRRIQQRLKKKYAPDIQAILSCHPDDELWFMSQ